jgi:uncharacterized peroxidase-related enzyme
MTTFTIHDLDSVPEKSKPFLQNSQQKFGMIPNLIGLLAESPIAVKAYLTMAGLFENSTFTAEERTVVWLSTIHDNDCSYCMAAHTGIAKSEKVDDAIIDALRAGQPLENPRLEALRAFVHAMVVERGWVDSEALEAFLAAGFTKENVLEVVVGVAQKTISNYANHIAATPVDQAFQRFAWKKPQLV